MPSYAIRRAKIIIILLVALLLGMTLRVAYLQTYGRKAMIGWAERQGHTNGRIVARRGSVFDRNGVVMAGTSQTQAVYLDPAFMRKEYQKGNRTLAQMKQDLRDLAAMLKINGDDLARVVDERADKEYVRIAENLDESLAARVMERKLPGVGLEPVCVRWFPMGTLAAQVIGTVGSEGQGLEGLELAFDKSLAGKNGFKRIEKDASRRAIGIDAEDYVPAQHGQHVVLTIDSNIQMLAEEVLAKACEHSGSKNGELIVIDPRTGEIMAMANWPTFNPNEVAASTKEQRLNRCTVVPYEPGSTLKPFIMGPAIASHVTRINEVWPIHGNPYITPYGRRVTDVHGYPPLCSWDVLVKSSNIGMAMLAARMGNTRLHQALTGFGFGRRTGIELPAEDPGLVWPLSKWTRYSTESVAQGYEMRVTPIQLARAFCVYANGGRLIRPSIVKGVVDADGKIIPRQAPPSLGSLPEVMAPESTAEVRRILSDVVVRGTGTKARSKYWNIFGKTGTSHISHGRQGYASSLFNSSFMAGAPLEDPRIVVVMILHEADRSRGQVYGGTIAAPWAGQLIERTLSYLQVPQSPPLPPPPAYVVPALYNFNPRLYGEATASAAE